MSLSRSLSALQKNKLIPGIVLDSLPGCATVQLGDEYGSILYGIPQIGPAPSVGDHVFVDYASGSPVLYTIQVATTTPTETYSGGAPLETGQDLDDSVDLTYKPTGDEPDEEFQDSALDSKWTVVSGSTGVVNIIQPAGSLAIYDLATRHGWLLCQVNYAGVYFYQNYTLPTGKTIIVCATPTAPASVPSPAAGAQAMGISLNNSTTTYVGTDYIRVGWRVYSTTSCYLWSDNPAGTLGSHAPNQYGEAFYFMIARTNTTYYTYFSKNGTTWTPFGSSTTTVAYGKLWFNCISGTTVGVPIPIQAIDWIRQGNLNPNPW